MKAPYVSAGFGNMIKAMYSPAFKNPANTFIIKSSSEESGLKTIQGLKAAYPEGAAFLTSQQAAQVEAMRDQPGICLLGVKPQIFSDPTKFKVEDLPSQFHNAKSLVASVMAGTTIAQIRKALPQLESGFRTMPNTPAKVGQGTIGTLQFGKNNPLADIFLADLADTSLVIPLSSEDQFHAFTAVAGSGPAFVFTLIEHLEKAVAASATADATETKNTAIDLLRSELSDILKSAPIDARYRSHLQTYLPAHAEISHVDPTIRALVREQLNEYITGSVEGADAFGLEAGVALPATLSTMLGSATLYERSPESLSQLRDAVTSKGGTTFAGLQQLLNRSPEGNVGAITRADMSATIKAAAERSIELAKG